jgi:hypothetical protein
MRTVLVLVGLLGLACSEGGGRAREEASAGSDSSVVPGAAGTGGTSGVTAGVAASGGDGATGAAPLDNGNIEGLMLGEPLELVAGTGMVPYAIGENDYGIQGGGFLARSALGNTVSVGTEPGKICIRGSLEEVPLNPDGHGNYGQYWGVEFGFNLNQRPAEGVAAPAPAAPTPVDAGADAADDAASGSAAADVAQPWQPGKVVGFSFVLEGPTINLVRFKSLPEGFDSSLESSVFCQEIHATSGAANNALFDQLSTYCWSGLSTLLPTSQGLNNISWQLPADVAPAGARPFDFCLEDLRPILTP